MSVIRVVVVDDQPMARAGIRMLLKNEEDIEVVAEAIDGQDALTQARTHRPDVILMDVRMPGTDGVAATRAVVEEGLTAQSGQPIRIIILTTYDIDQAIYDALQAGASGFLLKHVIPAEIAAAIRAVVAGGSWLDPSVALRLIDKFNTPPELRTPKPAQMNELTPREQEVLILLAQGLSNAEVGTQLHIAEATVRTHLARVMSKLDVREKAQAVIAAYQNGLVQAPKPNPP
ncbi:MAG: response regulator transcription factor [Pseudonocardiaceae bacterium]